MAKTTISLKATGFDGRSRKVGNNQLTKILQDDWELFFQRMGDMTKLFKRVEPMLEQANRDAFETGFAAGGVEHGYWAQKWREYVGADPDGATLLATGNLMNSFKRLRVGRKGKEQTLSYGWTAPYANDILEDHDWTFGIDGEEYDPDSSFTKTVEVPGRDFTEPVFEFIQKGVMRDLLEMKWKDIQEALNGK